MNNITLCGNLTKDPIVKRTTSEKMVTSGTLAVSRSYKIDGEVPTDYFDFDVWEQQAEYLSRFHKGDRVEIVGSMENQKFVKKDGSVANNWKVRVLSISAFATKSDAKTNRKVDDDETNDDLPF